MNLYLSKHPGSIGSNTIANDVRNSFSINHLRSTEFNKFQQRQNLVRDQGVGGSNPLSLYPAVASPAPDVSVVAAPAVQATAAVESTGAATAQNVVKLTNEIQ